MITELRAICAKHGVFLRREALGLGYTDRVIARLVKGGVIQPVRHGAYVPTDIWLELDEGQQHYLRARAAYRTANTEVVLSHTSSLMHFQPEHWELPLDDVHLTRTDGRTGRKEAGVRQHQGLILPGDIEFEGELAFMSATRTALELTTLVDVQHALVPINWLLHNGHTTKELLNARYVEMILWPDTCRTELVLRLCDALIESAGETRTNYLLFAHGLPVPELQYKIRDEFGNVIAEVDFAWPELGVFLEFDGKVKYGRLLKPGESASDVVVREKRREERICELTGWLCIRITWADLEHPERTVARIRRTFARAAEIRGRRFA